jgi:ABC-type polysaccharide/polyol phosphate export permease
MGSYLAAIWRCRYFWMSLVKTDLRTRYRRSMLGMGWSLLNPILMTIIMCLVFTKLFGEDLRNFAPSVLSGLTFWSYLVGCATLGCLCVFQGEKYIRQYPAPLAIYPLRTALGGMIHFLLALLVVLLLVWCVKGIHNLPALLMLIPSLVLLFLLGWSLALLTGFATVYFQDTQHLTEVGFQILFYATPIIYPPKVLLKHDMGWILRYNPMVRFLNLIREPILYGRVPSLATYGAAMLALAVLGVLSMLAVSKLERRLIFQL